ncbi:MAG: hypothetical protein ACOC91_01380, partial [bacterium]
MTDKGYYEPARNNGHEVHELPHNDAANGRDRGGVMILDGTPVPASEMTGENAKADPADEVEPTDSVESLEMRETDEIL